jgi:hypothetical protein
MLKRPTTSWSDVRLKCSDQDVERSWPRLACPRAAAHIWGMGTHILQRVQEYHSAPPGLTAKPLRKSSIFTCPRGVAGNPTVPLLYRDVSGRHLVPRSGPECSKSCFGRTACPNPITTGPKARTKNLVWLAEFPISLQVFLLPDRRRNSCEILGRSRIELARESRPLWISLA